MIWEPGKEYVCRDGRRARIYATDAGGDAPIHGAVMFSGDWGIKDWREDGKWPSGQGVDHARDLMPPRSTVVVSDAVLDAWAAEYNDGGPSRGRSIAALRKAIEQYISEQERGQ